MKKLAILGVVILVIVAVLLYFFVFSGIKCGGKDECLTKHFEACEKYKTEASKGILMINFQSSVDSRIEILGENEDKKCEIFFEVIKTNDELDKWAEGKSANCYFENQDQLSYSLYYPIKPLDSLKNNCKGSFVTEALERCRITGTYNDSYGRSGDSANCIGYDSSIDPLAICIRDKINIGKINCFESLEKIKLAYDQQDASLCLQVQDLNLRDSCSEGIDNDIGSYVSWYYKEFEVIGVSQ